MKLPWYKSIVERTFGSYNTQLLKGQPGGLFKEWIPDNYDPQKNAVVYNSPVLARLRSNLEKPDARRKSGCQQREKATIKYDPTDLS